MTATSMEPSTSVKRSKGFTIESIIGKDSDRHTEKQTPIREETQVRKTSEKHVSDRNKERESDVNERLRPRDLNISSADNISAHRTLPYQHHHQDHNIIDTNLNFISANRTSRTLTPPETLKHFHEAFVQNAGNMGVGLGPVNPQTLCRHPLSALNVSGYGQHIASPAQIHPMLMNRDIRQMYPYIDRYSGYFLPRYGVGGPPGLFFQPYRKPKRIRTAFSPSQLLQLEKSFEKSHYVVGQERKDLAGELQLSETQVKVWFQNRRTKHKRMKAEEDGTESTSRDNGGQEMTSPYPESHEDSDISDIDEYDDHHGDHDNFHNPHLYQQQLQSC